MRIDFSPPLWRRLGLSPATGVLLALGMGWGAVTVHEMLGLYSQGTLLRTALAQSTAADAAARRHPGRRTSALAPEQASAINRAVLRLNLPWRDLFDALEEATPDSIAVIGLDPDVDHQIMHLSAEAATPADMIRYLQLLQQRGEFSSVFLKKQQIDAQDTGHPLRFLVELRWRATQKAAQ